MEYYKGFLGVIGLEGKLILRNAGLEIDEAQVALNIDLKLSSEKKNRDFENQLTSELVYNSRFLGDDYAKNVLDRLSMIGFGFDDFLRIYCIEKLLIAPGNLNGFSQIRKGEWSKMEFFHDGYNTLPLKEQASLSELVMITEDANSKFAGYKRDFKNPNYLDIVKTTTRSKSESSERAYYNEFFLRAELMGFSLRQAHIFYRNEHNIRKRQLYGTEIDSWTRYTCKSIR